ncbi:hypothetical protein B0O99DRAFT_170934 [Bisporella sp. PMI_857]|nr:hypothetical protein B0O99DRAFT_170934 [Bisporella sp. PMI_857]
MEAPTQRRDINELLVNGYFKTSRARSPAGSTPTTNAPSFLTTPAEQGVSRPQSVSRSRGPPRRPPPRPTVEDEAISLSKESFATSSAPSYDPPLRGIIDQWPVILEADVSLAEAAKLQGVPSTTKEQEENPERRFVFIPKPDSESDQADAPSRRGPKSDVGTQARREGENLQPRPPVERRRSRQDLPSLQTKVPRDIPPQYRRSASGYGGLTPTENDINSQQPSSRTPGESLLSPDAPRGKDYFGSAPRHHRTSSFGGRSGTSTVDKRKSGSSIPGGSWTEPSMDNRHSGSFDKLKPVANEKLTRPQELSEEYRRRDRHTRGASTHSARLSAGGSDREKSGRSSSHSNRRYQSDSESDFGDSGSERGHRRRHHRHRELQVEDHHRRSASRSNRSSMNSRYNISPVPSPSRSPNRARERERAETFPQRSGSRSPIDRPLSPFSPFEETSRPSDRLNPMDLPAGPRSRQSHSISTPTVTTATPTSNRPAVLPIPIPMSNNHPENTRMPLMPSADDNRSQTARPADPKPYWQPPPFQPPSNTLQKPVGSFRRYSEDVQKGIIPLPSCPRTNFVRGKNDWLTLPRCHEFDICPSCFNSTIAPTEFRDLFVRAPYRDGDIICDFGSSPWYRIAWLLTRKMGRRDLGLFYDLAKIASIEPQCEAEKEAIRPWHSLVDPKTRNFIPNFHVCYSCVRSVEALLPPITGLFRPLHPKRPMGDPRICDLRFNSKRFIQYFDTLETTADKAVDIDAPPDTRALMSLCKRMAMFPECQRDTDLTDAYWNVITQLPEFTVCEECFDEVVWPELEDEKAIPMMFNKKLQKIGKASCQLYSPKMRGIFRTAVDGNDYMLLASKARERRSVEMQVKKDLDGLRRMVKQGNPEALSEISRVEEEWKKWE